MGFGLYVGVDRVFGIYGFGIYGFGIYGSIFFIWEDLMVENDSIMVFFCRLDSFGLYNCNDIVLYYTHIIC